MAERELLELSLEHHNHSECRSETKAASRQPVRSLSLLKHTNIQSVYSAFVLNR